MGPYFAAFAFVAYIVGTIIFYVLRWYRQKEQHEFSTVNLNLFAIEHDKNFFQDTDRYIANILSRHQIRSTAKFKIANVFQKEIKEANSYIFDYTFTDSRDWTQHSRHVVLLEFENLDALRFKLSRNESLKEIFSAAGLPKIPNKQVPNWLNNQAMLYGSYKNTDDILAYLKGKEKLQSVIADENFEEMFFNGNYVGVFYTGALQPDAAHFQELERVANLVASIVVSKKVEV